MSASPSAFEPLRQYLAERAAFTEDEFALMRTLFVPRTLGPGDFFQRAGQAATHAAFVASGCLRSYVIDAKGKEHIVMFAPESWWYADIDSLGSGTPSQYFVDAVEESALLLIDPPSPRKLSIRFPAMPPRSAPGCSGTPRRKTAGSSVPSARRPRSAIWSS